MFAINIKNFKKTKILHIFFKKIFLLFTVILVMSMREYLKRNNKLKYQYNHA